MAWSGALALHAAPPVVQLPSTQACVTEDGTAGACGDGVALVGASQVAVSPDGRHAYVASQISDAIVVFDRHPTTGALTQKAGMTGCTSETGTGGACVVGIALDSAR